MASRKAGRPSSFKPEFVEQARKVYQLGATDREVADVLDVAESTIYRWAKEHPEFAQAMKVGKEAADDRVERSLYHKAVGYTYPSEKVFQIPGRCRPHASDGARPARHDGLHLLAQEPPEGRLARPPAA